MSQEMQKIRDELIDHIDKALISKADQIPASWSTIMKDLTKKLDDHIITHEKDTTEIRQKLEPISQAYANVTGFRAVLLTVSSLLLAGWGTIEIIKKMTNK